MRVDETLEGPSSLHVSPNSPYTKSIRRFSGDIAQPPVDERTWVVGFVIHNPKLEGNPTGPSRREQKSNLSFATKRFAEEIVIKDGIWFVHAMHASKMDDAKKNCSSVQGWWPSGKKELAISLVFA